MEIQKANLKERISQAIDNSILHAALFSTYTFSRNFFEHDIYENLLCVNGQRRGTFPLTILMDRNKFVGQGWGYDVFTFKSSRLWHPKTSVFMLEDRTKNADKRTLLVVGSGNLTKNGWEKNQELFIILEWCGWRLPYVLEQWVSSTSGAAANTNFGHWYNHERNKKLGYSKKPPAYVQESLLSNYQFGNVWDQWNWQGLWKEAFVVTPYSDLGDAEETNSFDTFYLDKLVESAHSKGSILQIFLQSASDGKVYGNWSIINKLRHKVRLEVFCVENCSERQLHAKIHIVHVGGLWYVLGGSPNASSKAMLLEKGNGGNVELAWQAKSSGLPSSLLPSGKRIKLVRKNFIELPTKTTLPRWNALEFVSYDPKNRLLSAQWFPKRSTEDTQIFFANKEITLPAELNLGEERAVSTFPRNQKLQEKYHPDWVPITLPHCNTSDDPLFSKVLSLEECLCLLQRKELNEDETEDLVENSLNVDKQSSKLSEGSTKNGFEWNEKAIFLERALKGLQNQILNCSSNTELSWLTKSAELCLEATNSPSSNQNILVTRWREWVRAEIVRILLSLDTRKTQNRPFVLIAKKWKKKINPILRKAL